MFTVATQYDKVRPDLRGNVLLIWYQYSIFNSARLQWLVVLIEHWIHKKKKKKNDRSIFLDNTLISLSFFLLEYSKLKLFLNIIVISHNVIVRENKIFENDTLDLTRK